jgi:hypothetical protein
LLFVVVVNAAAVACSYSFELNRSINSKWAIVPLFQSGSDMLHNLCPEKFSFRDTRHGEMV